MKEIEMRRSIRRYQPNRPVPRELIEKLMRAAMAAPSAGNQQPWEYVIVQDKTLLAQLSTASPYAGCVKEAPLAIVACYRQTGLRFPEYAQIDSAIACENILLAAAGLGLGAVWLGIAPLEKRMQAVEQILNLPAQNLRAFAILAVGYPAEEPARQDRYDSARVHFAGGKEEQR